MRALALTAVVCALGLAACGGGGEPAARSAPSASGFAFTGGNVLAGEPIDARYTCDGDDLSPALEWIGAPDGTRELALVVEDPDADGFTHWLVYALPPGATQLPQGVPDADQIPGPTPLSQGENGFGDVGYRGPCPPEGEEHTYVFRLLALDRELDVPPGASRSDFDEAAAGHVLAEATLEAPYTRGG